MQTCIEHYAEENIKYSSGTDLCLDPTFFFCYIHKNRNLQKYSQPMKLILWLERSKSSY